MIAERENRFGRWLEATLESRGMSQAEVARDLGVADAQVSRWRRGQATPSLPSLQRLAQALHVPRTMLEELAGYTPPSVAGEDPERDAALRAHEARFHAVLEQLPPSLWSAYLSACEALAAELRHSLVAALELAIEEAGAAEVPGRRIGFHGTE
jgi:transcriptional regulator with XRE-family HTH domain